jgi:hypothetical protein
MAGSLAPVMYWAILTTLCRALRSEDEQLPNQATGLSKHFMTTDVSATGQQLYRQATLVLLGTGIMLVCLKHVGVTDSVRDWLKMSVKTLASWLAHARSTHSGNLSDPSVL